MMSAFGRLVYPGLGRVSRSRAMTIALVAEARHGLQPSRAERQTEQVGE
jgi:hypothetical protein